jgi:hypothetical protein
MGFVLWNEFHPKIVPAESTSDIGKVFKMMMSQPNER